MARKQDPSARSAVQAGDGSLPEPNAPRALNLAMTLMAIPGPSGQEAQVVDAIVRALRRAGAPSAGIETDRAHHRTPIEGQVGNLIFKLPGTVRRPRRLLSAHLDTVPICVGSRPVIRGGFVESADPTRGAGADDRAGAAVVLNTALEILERKLPHPPLTFLWPVQEEIGLHGARNVGLRALGPVRLGFNFDGGPAEKLTIGATGGYRLDIEIEGRASHAGGAPQEGVSAIAIASLAIADLVREGWHGSIQQGKHSGTSNVGFIHGGEATNVVTDRVLVKAEARSHDPEFRRRIVRTIEKAFEQAARHVRNVHGQCGRVQCQGRLDYESFRLDRNEPCVLAAQAAVRSVGLEPILAIANGGLDANWLTAHGIATVTLGCGQVSIHTADDKLDVAAFERACRIALRLATDTA